MAYDTPIFVVDVPLNAQAYVYILRTKGFDARVLLPGPPASLSLPDRSCVLFEMTYPHETCLFAWAAELRSVHPGVCIIPWTLRPRPFFLWAAYRLGFHSVLDKGTTLEEAMPLFRALLEGSASWPEALWQEAQGWDKEVAPLLLGLSGDLWRVWDGLLSGLDVKEMAEKLGVSEGTVRRKRKVLFETLGVRGWAEAVRKACGWGLTVGGDGDVRFHPLVEVMFRRG